MADKREGLTELQEDGWHLVWLRQFRTCPLHIHISLSFDPRSVPPRPFTALSRRQSVEAKEFVAEVGELLLHLLCLAQLLSVPASSVGSPPPGGSTASPLSSPGAWRFPRRVVAESSFENPHTTLLPPFAAARAASSVYLRRVACAGCTEARAFAWTACPSVHPVGALAKLERPHLAVAQQEPSECVPFPSSA